jgi:hypothetical protein
MRPFRPAQENMSLFPFASSCHLIVKRSRSYFPVMSRAVGEKWIAPVEERSQDLPPSTYRAVECEGDLAPLETKLAEMKEELRVMQDLASDLLEGKPIQPVTSSDLRYFSLATAEYRMRTIMNQKNAIQAQERFLNEIRLEDGGSRGTRPAP